MATTGTTAESAGLRGNDAAQGKHTASQVIGHAQDPTAARPDGDREAAAGGFQAVAQAFRLFGDDLRSRQEGPITECAAELGTGIAKQIERAAAYLHSRNLHQFAADAAAFGKRSPALFMGAAFLLGIAAARILKSSTGSYNTRESDRSGTPQERGLARSAALEPTLSSNIAAFGVDQGQESNAS